MLFLLIICFLDVLLCFHYQIFLNGIYNNNNNINNWFDKIDFSNLDFDLIKKFREEDDENRKYESDIYLNDIHINKIKDLSNIREFKNYLIKVSYNLNGLFTGCASFEIFTRYF